MTQPVEQANAAQIYEISQSDLPISCPTEQMAIWNSHPRVFLPLDEDNREEVCPYCGTKFVLKD